MATLMPSFNSGSKQQRNSYPSTTAQHPKGRHSISGPIIGSSSSNSHNNSKNGSVMRLNNYQDSNPPRLIPEPSELSSSRAMQTILPQSLPTTSGAAFSPMHSPVPQRHIPKAMSLVGFDPLVPTGGPNKLSSSPRWSAAPVAPQPQLEALSRLSLSEPTREKRSGSPESPAAAKRELRTPATPSRSSQSSQRPSSSRLDVFRISAPGKKEKKKQQQQQQDDAAAQGKPQTPPRAKLPWGKGHRRTKSMEKSHESMVEAAQKAASKDDSAETKPSVYPSMVNDLMDLKYGKLAMPSLAKPSPTSFLTGREDEVVRTCEYEAAPFQTQIPPLSEFVVSARLIEFVENYRRIDQNFDLQQWKGLNNMDLRNIQMPQHIPIAQLLMECGDDVSLQGVVASGSNADDRLEVAVFEGQRHFIAVFRGTTEQQAKPGSSKSKKKAVPLDSDHPNVEVYQFFLEEYQKIETQCFELLDRLTEEHPFCDVIFTGHSFGAALATLAAVRFSNARPSMRSNCYPMSSPKVGFENFRRLVHSSPNLRVVRLEYGQDARTQLPGPSGCHAGHTIVLHGSLGHNSHKTKQPALAYRFEAPKPKKFKTTHPDLRSYVTALEEIVRLKLPWVKDFVGTSGKGVVVNNEARQVV